MLTDSFYTLLLALDGAASSGGRQEMFDLRAEDGTPITGSGKLEALAYERFHNVAGRFTEGFDAIGQPAPASAPQGEDEFVHLRPQRFDVRQGRRIVGKGGVHGRHCVGIAAGAGHGC